MIHIQFKLFNWSCGLPLWAYCIGLALIKHCVLYLHYSGDNCFKHSNVPIFRSSCLTGLVAYRYEPTALVWPWLKIVFYIYIIQVTTVLSTLMLNCMLTIFKPSFHFQLILESIGTLCNIATLTFTHGPKTTPGY